MLAGLPKALSARAAIPTTTPAKTTVQFTFFIHTSIYRLIRISALHYMISFDKNRMENTYG